MKRALVVILLSLGGLFIAASGDEAAAKRTHSLEAPQAAARPVATPNALADKFRLALIEEETGQHLDSAIQAYQNVIAAMDAQRQMAVTAIFHLGECYRKQGRTNDAMTQYDRILRDFSEQKQVVELARRRGDELAPDRKGKAMVQAPGAASQKAFDPEQVRMVREEIALVEKQLETLQVMIQCGKATSSELLKPRQDLFMLKRLLPEYAEAATQKSLIEQQLKLVEERLQALRNQIQVGVAPPLDTIPIEREILGLRRELLAVSPAAPAAEAGTATPKRTE